MATLLPSLWGRGERSGHDPFMTLHREIDRLFDDLHRWPMGMRQGEGGMTLMQPAIDMCETENGLEIDAELPGVDENDIELSLEQDRLMLRGHKRMDRSEDEKGQHLVERSYGSFQRMILLPFECDPNSVKATFDKGVLRIMLPRPKEEHAKSHKIPIGKSHDGDGGTSRSGGRNGETRSQESSGMGAQGSSMSTQSGRAAQSVDKQSSGAQGGSPQGGGSWNEPEHGPGTA